MLKSRTYKDDIINGFRDMLVDIAEVFEEKMSKHRGK